VDKQEKQFVKSVLLAFASLLPGGNAVKSLADPLLDQLIRETKDNPLTRAAKETVETLSRGFHAAEEAGVVNRGTGYSAAADFGEIVRKAGISPRLLVDLGLDPGRLEEHLRRAGADELREASAGRRGLVLDGLRVFSTTIVEAAPQSPAVQAEFMRAVLAANKPPRD